jgi:hypothetical protein
VRPLVERSDARLVTPSWVPDGSGVLFAANVGERPFNVYEVSLNGVVRQVTDSTSGAQDPELSPDGRTLLYVGYTPDGSDLFSLPVDRESWRTVSWPSANAAPPDEQIPAATLTPYRPWRTLVPTYWTPIVSTDAGEVVVGAATAMTDALGGHSYAVDASWAQRARPDWHVTYAYDRWWPTLFGSYSDDTDPVDEGEIRTRELFTGALLPFRRVRFTETLLAALDFERDTLHCPAPCTAALTAERRHSWRAGWLHDSRREFGYSISSEEGFQVETAIEGTRSALGSDGDATAAILDARLFQRLFQRHTVLAGRAAFAGAWGDANVTRVFAAGGAGPAIAAFDFGRDSIGLLRGFGADDLVGSHAAVVNVDLRFPLGYLQRGLGSWPIFFRSIHGAVFGDAGQAWNRTFRFDDLRTSAGGELSSDVVIGHYLAVTLTGGAAWTRDPVAGSSGGAVFGRIGRAF